MSLSLGEAPDHRAHGAGLAIGRTCACRAKGQTGRARLRLDPVAPTRERQNRGKAPLHCSNSSVAAKSRRERAINRAGHSRLAHAWISIGHCSSRVRERLFCTAKPAPYGVMHPAIALLHKTEKDWSIAMKTILSALVALSVIAGVAGAASALDAKTFYEQVDRNHY